MKNAAAHNTTALVVGPFLAASQAHSFSEHQYKGWIPQIYPEMEYPTHLLFESSIMPDFLTPIHFTSGQTLLLFLHQQQP